MSKDTGVLSSMLASAARAAAGLTGIAKQQVHNRELHELAEMRRYGGYQFDMFQVR